MSLVERYNARIPGVFLTSDEPDLWGPFRALNADRRDGLFDRLDDDGAVIDGRTGDPNDRVLLGFKQELPG